MVFRFGNNNGINKNPRDFDKSWIKSAAGNNSFYLNDDNAAAVFDSLCDAGTFKGSDFLFKTDIAVFICISASDKSNVDREAFVEELLLTAKGNNLNHIFSCSGIQASAAVSRINESFKTDIRDHTGFVTGNGSEKMKQCSLRNVVGFHFIVHSHFDKCRGCVPVTNDGPFQKSFMGKAVTASAVTIALRSGIDQSQIFRCSGLKKTFLKCTR